MKFSASNHPMPLSLPQSLRLVEAARASEESGRGGESDSLRPIIIEADLEQLREELEREYADLMLR